MFTYAKNQPSGFKNTIERVAIVGVSNLLSNTTYTTILTNYLRPEAPLERTSLQPSLKPENTQSQPSPAKTAAINSPRVSSSPQLTTTMRPPLSPLSRTSNFSSSPWPPQRPGTPTVSLSRQLLRLAFRTSCPTDTVATLTTLNWARRRC